jgi:adenosylcobyric acid synthase
MICGTTSGAGKSLLTTALARWYARRGLKVAPFKAQNMSNNARVVADGEMGSAQYFQALAARCTPDVRMNPVLLKPERDTQSQVILLGQRRDDLSRLEWRARSEHLWPTIRNCLHELLADNDVVVIEGAGSPAEINLSSTDIVNMRVAAAADAATLIVCDIDRGGAFAHLYGTHQLLPPEDRALVRGFVLNKFRGDVALLAPGPQMLESLTGVPTVAVLPMWRDHGLPEEDGVFDARPSGAGLSVAIVAYPRISNLDEFSPLKRVPGISLSWARHAQTIASADLLIMPGSKQVPEDLKWLRATGLDVAIAAHVRADKPTLAVCGGLQILGGHLHDPHGVEGDAQGLGLLPLSTEFQATKRYRHATYEFSGLQGFWAALGGVRFAGYEIRHGATRADAGATASSSAPASASAVAASAPVHAPFGVPVLADNCGWQCGQTLALYVHGLLENPGVMHGLFGQGTPTLDDTFDGLAEFLERHCDERTLLSWIA